MLFNNYIKESDDMETNDIDAVNKDPDTEEGAMNIANEIERACEESALENITFFENGEQALKEFCESEQVQALVEARKMSKKTFVRLGKTDDLTRRTNLACLILARENHDPLWKKLALNRVNERKIRNAIYKRYRNKGERIAKLSQKQHIKDMQKMKALPAIKFN